METNLQNGGDFIMATYSEIYDISSNSSIRNKIAVAVIKKAQSLLDGATPTTAQVSFSNKAFINPIPEADKIFNYILAANSSATKSQIESSSDAVIQTNVDSAVTALIAGGIYG